MNEIPSSVSYVGVAKSRECRPFWAHQVVHAREAARMGHPGSNHALARTLLNAYRHGGNAYYLTESLPLFRDIHDRYPSMQSLTQLSDALLAEHMRTGLAGPIEDILAFDHVSSPYTSLQTPAGWRLVEARLAHYELSGCQSDLLHVKQLIQSFVASTEADLDFPEGALETCALYHISVWHATIEPDDQGFQRVLDAVLTRLGSGSTTMGATRLLASCIEMMTIALRKNIAKSLVDVNLARIIILTTYTLHEHAYPACDRFALVLALFWLYVSMAVDFRSPEQLATAKELTDELFLLAGTSIIDKARAHWARGIWLSYNYKTFRSGDLDSLDQAVICCREALASCPPHHVFRLRCCSILTATLNWRFAATGRWSDLDEVIKMARSNTDILPHSPAFTVNTANAVHWRVSSRCLRASTKESMLEFAVESLNVTLIETPQSTGWHAMLLGLLSALYMLQAKLGFAVAKGKQLTTARAALAACPPEFDLKTTERYHSTLQLADVLVEIAMIEQSSDALSESFELVNAMQPEWTRMSGDVRSDVVDLRARCFLARFKLFGDVEDLSQGWKLFELAYNNAFEPLTLRMEIASTWAQLVAQVESPAAALRAYRHAVNLLSQLGLLAQSSSARTEITQLAEGMASRAALLALNAHDISGAVELLEQSRGVMWSHLVGLQSSYNHVPPEYTESFSQITRILRDEKINDDERRKHAAELDSIVAKIRDVQGYERFLLPRVYAELSAGSSEGPVVIIIPHDNASDVLVVREPAQQPLHIRLPLASSSCLQQLASRLKRMADRSRDYADRKMKKVDVQHTATADHGYASALKELWTLIVYPIIVHLEIKPSAKRPRLWWCPVGALAELPLHAAGVYVGAHQDNAANYIVSSYTPTLSALIHARAERTDTVSEDVLLVSLPEAQSMPSLPNAVAEANIVQSAVSPGSLTVMSDLQATVQAVLGRLPDIAVLHLACHGHQSQENPLNSGFSMYDGRLRLEQLMGLQLPKAQLAYLSACETAGTDENQPDEAINLAATMLFVGFRTVVATMWSMNDLDGPFIAKRVYSSIFVDGKLDLSAVPYALDAAVRELRETGADPSRWATYVHIGA